MERQEVETKFFQKIDQDGQHAHAKLLRDGVDALNIKERWNFAYFLQSLVTRQPEIVTYLRTSGARYFAREMDRNEDIKDGIKALGLDISGSELVTEMYGMSFSDRAMLTVQGATVNGGVAKNIVEGKWYICNLDRFDGHCVLGDWPVVRTGDYLAPTTIWVLPLSPSAMFISTRSRDVLNKIKAGKASKLAKVLNSDQALRASKYVFSTVHTGLGWLESRFRHVSENPRNPLQIAAMESDLD